jgi:hypothetical protein
MNTMEEDDTGDEPSVNEDRDFVDGRRGRTLNAPSLQVHVRHRRPTEVCSNVLISDAR